MTKTTSFQAAIRPLFTERDIQGMSEACNLGSYGDVKIARWRHLRSHSWNRGHCNAAPTAKKRGSQEAISD